MKQVNEAKIRRSQCVSRGRTSYRRGTVLVGVLLLVPILLYLAREPLLIAAGRFLNVGDAEAPADYIVVLGGDAETRPFTAAALYRKRLAPKVLIFQHKTDRISELGLVPTHDELYRRILEVEGVPSEAIERVPGEVDSSWDEAFSLRRFLISQPARRIILVTSEEHTRRARWVFRKALAGLDIEMRMAAAYHLTFNQTNWWKNDTGALLYLHEYLKFSFYWLRSCFPLSLQEHGEG